MESDLLLKFSFVDRTPRNVYHVFERVDCDSCHAKHWEPTGQELRVKVKDGKLVLDGLVLNGP